MEGQHVISCGHDALDEIGEDESRLNYELVGRYELHFFWIASILPLMMWLNSYSSKFNPQIVSGRILVNPSTLSCLMFLRELLLSCSAREFGSSEPFSRRRFLISLKEMPIRTGKSKGLLSIHSKYFPAILLLSKTPWLSTKPSHRERQIYHSSVPSPGFRFITPPPRIMMAFSTSSSL